MCSPPPPYEVGDICVDNWTDDDADDWEFFEIIDQRWDPINDDNWLVRVLTGPKAGTTRRIWAHKLYRVNPLLALAAQAK